MSAPHSFDAGVQMCFRIGQRVRHTDYKGQRVTGVVRALSVDGEQGLMVSIALDAPIVIPEGHGYRAIDIHNQHAPAHEFSPFDERDELVAELLTALQAAVDLYGKPGGPWNVPGSAGSWITQARGAIAKATGGQP